MLLHENGGLHIGGSSAPEANGITIDGNAVKPGGCDWSMPSDARLKKNITPYNLGLDKLAQIRPVSYNYTQESGYDSGQTHIGIIAQELLEIAPEMVSINEETGYYQVNFSAATYMMINAIKELKQANEDLESKLKKQNALETRLQLLERQFETMANK